MALGNLQARFEINVTGYGDLTPEMEKRIEALEQLLTETCAHWQKFQSGLKAEIHSS